MPNRVFKFLLICWCVLALPMQGVAAWTRVACTAGHFVHAEVKVQALHEGCEDIDADEGWRHLAVHGSPSGATRGSAALADKHGTCAAACCIGMGVATTLPSWPEPLQCPADWSVDADALLASFTGDALERPPKPADDLT